MYCIPKGFKGFQEPEHWLSFVEWERLATLFARKGVKHIRLTGGEPLLRKNLPDLVARLSVINGIEDISLSSNALRLKHHARALQQAGLKRLNISLDSLKPDRFQSITGGKLQKVLAGIDAAQAADIERVKINMVVMRGINDDEVESMLAFCLDRGLTLRLIETMPMGDTGRLASHHYISLQSIKERLSQQYELIPEVPAGSQWTAGPAKYMRIAGRDSRIGFITPISDHFCEQCNRVRLSVEGTLYLCLGQNDSLKLGRLMRTGYSDTAIDQVVEQAIKHKPERHEFTEKPAQIIRFMSTTGG